METHHALPLSEIHESKTIVTVSQNPRNA